MTPDEKDTAKFWILCLGFTGVVLSLLVTDLLGDVIGMLFVAGVFLIPIIGIIGGLILEPKGIGLSLLAAFIMSSVVTILAGGEGTGTHGNGLYIMTFGLVGLYGFVLTAFAIVGAITSGGRG